MKPTIFLAALILISSMSYAGCPPKGDQVTYGTSNVWIGYVSGGSNFNRYKGYVTEGVASSPDFDENFGGTKVNYSTNGCAVLTDTFSVRYKLTQSFVDGDYTFTVGGDDGYRLSLDGGSTYVINKWNDQGYTTTTYTAILTGTYNMVLDYYENGGANRVSFAISGGTVLPVTLTGFQGEFKSNHQVELSWKTMMERDIDHYEMERSADGLNFKQIGSISSKMTISTNDYQLLYNYTDQDPLPGTSYYRIKVIGKDNYTNQSPIVQMSNNQIQGIKIYPTLVQNNTVFVETNKTLRDARMEFFDLSGKKLSETNWESLSGRQNCPVSRSNRLPAGTYLARLTAKGQTIKNQLMIVQNN